MGSISNTVSDVDAELEELSIYIVFVSLWYSAMRVIFSNDINESVIFARMMESESSRKI